MPFATSPLHNKANKLFQWTLDNSLPKLSPWMLGGKPNEINILFSNYCVLSNFGATGDWSNEMCGYPARFACGQNGN